MSPSSTPSRPTTARDDTATDVPSVRFNDAAGATRREARPGIVVADDDAGSATATDIREAAHGWLAADQDLHWRAMAA
ncbi:hypothetical protein [Methylobacterium platani]|uniref:Uncharacterized protein n=2 Tax=Methylobacterium platani TaxID=427683 RepID=A0A179S0J9_9HYPH|nr:hypothetical protein [Methylobacterium platani]KMO13140.1 hypothetical protein SQ03_22505 [Methylobacterium platani JCM 14648]OAS18752.1 hypothetical protein A5481_25790 [Methylobacterium platani]